MSKLKTYGVVSLSPMSRYFSPYLRPMKDLTKLTENQKQLVVGVQQRENVLPKSASLADNTKRVSFIQPHPAGTLHTSMEGSNNVFAHNSLVGRNAKIFFQDTSHMHNVPAMPKGYKWVVQHERQAVFKNPCMGWTFVHDSFSKRVVKFADLEQAISFCRKMGFGYEVEYPHFRYHQKKSYSDNFKWKGPPKHEDDF